MSTTRRTEAIKGVESHLAELEKFDIEGNDLVRKQWGEYSLEDERPTFEEVFRTVKVVSGLKDELTSASLDTLGKLNEALGRVRQVFGSISEMKTDKLFVGNEPKPKAQRDNQVIGLYNCENDLKAALVPLLSWHTYVQRGSAEEKSREVLAALERAVATAKNRSQNLSRKFARVIGS